MRPPHPGEGVCGFHTRVESGDPEDETILLGKCEGEGWIALCLDPRGLQGTEKDDGREA